jgi:hypothetical protein
VTPTEARVPLATALASVAVKPVLLGLSAINVQQTTMAQAAQRAVTAIPTEVRVLLVVVTMDNAVARLALLALGVTSVLSVNMALLVLLLATVILMAVPTLLPALELVASALVKLALLALGVTSVLSVNMALLVLILATVILMAVPTLLPALELAASALVKPASQVLSATNAPPRRRVLSVQQIATVTSVAVSTGTVFVVVVNATVRLVSLASIVTSARPRL